MENPLPEVPHETYRLSNGLTVVLVEDHTVPLVAVNVNYQVGSKNERVGRTGFAHLFEHMMFQGSKHFDDDYFKALQDVGGRVNGGTNTDRTRYWEVVPAAHAERALWLEADRMGFLLDAMTQERLDNQISVVQNERRQRYENAPYGTVREKVLEVLYPPNHPYSWTTIGSMADLAAATLEDVQEFFRTYYTPNNASLTVAGDFDPDEMRRLITKYFGAIPPGRPVSRLDAWQPRLDSERVLEIVDRVQLPRTYAFVPTVPIYSGDDAALDVFGRILGGGKTSRLYQELVYEREIAQDAFAYNNSSQIAGTFELVVTPRPGHSLEEVEAAAFDVLRRALEEGVTAGELERAQTMITAYSVRSMEQIGGFSGISDQMNAYVHYLGEPDRFRWDLQRYLDLTPESVTATARRHLAGEGRVVARVRPMPALAAAAEGEAVTVDRSTAPGPAAARTLDLPDPTRFRLGNGLEVVLVERHQLPLVSAGLIVRGGAAADPADRAGLASLTADLLDEGAGGRSATALAEALEALGAQLDTGADTDMVFAGLEALKPRLTESLALLADVVARPELPATELDRLRARRLVRLQQLEDQPEYLAQVALRQVIFGQHPYGHLPIGTRAGLQAITLEDVQGFWARVGVPANATLVVVGDLTRGELEDALGETLGTWTGGAAPRLELPAPAQHGPRTVYVLDRPGSAQSVITAGLVGVPRTTDDYPALQVMNMALGGQFVSRLNLNLREDKGYTYGARSYLETNLLPGAFFASTPVDTGVTAAAVREVVRELTDIVGARPLSAEELEYARGAIVNGYAQRFETMGGIGRQLAEVILYDLPADALERYPEQVAATTPQQVAEAAARLVDPEKLAILVVGDATKVVPELEALALGPIVRVDAQGQRVSGS